MIEAINEAIINGLKGGNAHNDPMIILKGLTPQKAHGPHPYFVDKRF